MFRSLLEIKSQIIMKDMFKILLILKEKNSKRIVLLRLQFTISKILNPI